jgi:hypothetical protein
VNPDLPSPPDHSKTLIIIIATAVAAAFIGYAAYHQFTRWHAKEIQSAVSIKDQKMARTKAELEAQIQILRNQPPPPVVSPAVPPEDSPAVSDERQTEVFGGLPSDSDAESGAERSCEALNQKITAFFDYLGRQAKPAADTKKVLAPGWVAKIIVDLSASLPLVVGETRDMASLKRNETHFFRVLKKDRIHMVKTVLQMDRAVLEHALADGYQYYVSKECCKSGDLACVSLKTLYEYAGFFMTTFSGKSYLLRRDSTLRCLTTYYCVLILDAANDAELNQYGIDIRPQINAALDAVSHQTSLIFKDRYIDTLNGLKAKYAKKIPVLPEAAADNDAT